MSRTAIRFSHSADNLYTETFRRCMDCRKIVPLIDMAKFGVTQLARGVAINRCSEDHPEGKPWKLVEIPLIGGRCNKCEGIFDQESKLAKMKCPAAGLILAGEHYHCVEAPGHGGPHRNPDADAVWGEDE